MSKKSILLCLGIASFLLIFIAVFINISANSQPLYMAQEEIIFPAPSLQPLQAKSPFALVLEMLLPIGILATAVIILYFFAKKYFKKIKHVIPKALCILLCVLCLATSINLAHVFAETGFTPISPSQYYGRKQLETMSNSSSLLYAYDKMAEGIENHASEITVQNLFHSVTRDEWLVVMYTYLYDYPQHFWMDSSYRYKYKNGENGEMIIVQILPNYVFSASELATARETFAQEANEILAKLSPDMDEYQLELTIHNELCNRITYNESDHAHSAYGGLVTGVAVCEGYGKAFQYLLNQVGIESTLATGVGKPAGSSTPENHAWNFVKINGKYYFTDVTWDDQNEPYYGYFNITTKMLNLDHALANYPYTFPECTALDDNYFQKNNGFMDTFNASQLIEMLKYNLSTHVYVTSNTDNFNATVLNNSKVICDGLNMVNSSTIRIQTLGRERMIIVVGRRRGDLNNDNILDQNDIDLLNTFLTNSSTITDKDALEAADYNNDGKIDQKDSKNLANFVAGLPVVDEPEPFDPSSHAASGVSSNVTSPVSSTVSSASGNPTPSLQLGDINDDSFINAKDALVVLKISVNKYNATESEKIAANVNKDNAINAKDALEILKKSVNKPACF